MVELVDAYVISWERENDVWGVVVKNFVGFFIESVAGTAITGRLTRHPGLIRNAAPILIDASTFLRAALLVQ